MNTIKITDLTTKSNPIQLISCLQNERNREGKHYFHESDFMSFGNEIKEVVRLAKVELDAEYDLIAVYFNNYINPNIYLGHWNDGVLENIP